MASETTDIIELSKTVTLRRDDLYQGIHTDGSSACWCCASHIRPEAVFAHPVVRRWLIPFNQWKLDRPAHHDVCPVADPGKRVWQAVRRWANGSAADFNVVDRLFSRLGHSMTPWDFGPEAWLRRVSFPWDETQYSARIAYAWALYNASRVINGQIPYTDITAAQRAGELLPDPLNIHPQHGGSCPVCGGFGAGFSKVTTSAERHAATRRRKRALAKVAMGVPAGSHSRRHEESLQLALPAGEGARDARRSSGRDPLGTGHTAPASERDRHSGHIGSVLGAGLVHPQSGFAQLVLFGGAR